MTARGASQRSNGATDGTVAAYRLPALRHDQPGAARQTRQAREPAAAAAANAVEALFDGHPVALDTARFERHLAKSGIPLLIDFWAPWCGPCRMMAPEFERAAALLEPAVRLVKVNVDEEPALAARFRVQSIPTLALAFEGSELARAAGARSAPQLVEWTRAALAQAKV